jgi:hypothetical protein
VHDAEIIVHGDEPIALLTVQHRTAIRLAYALWTRSPPNAGRVFAPIGIEESSY